MASFDHQPFRDPTTPGGVRAIADLKEALLDSFRSIIITEQAHIDRVSMALAVELYRRGADLVDTAAMLAVTMTAPVVPPPVAQSRHLVTQSRHVIAQARQTRESAHTRLQRVRASVHGTDVATPGTGEAEVAA